MPRLERARVDRECQAQRADLADAGHLGQQLADRVGLMLLPHPAFQSQDPLIALGHLPAQKCQHLLGRVQHRLLGRHDFEQCRQLAGALDCHDAELGGMAAHAMTSCVRCRTSNSRAESTIASACCLADRTASLGIPGRAAT